MSSDTYSPLDDISLPPPSHTITLSHETLSQAASKAHKTTTKVGDSDTLLLERDFSPGQLPGMIMLQRQKPDGRDPVSFSCYLSGGPRVRQCSHAEDDDVPDAVYRSRSQ